MQDFTKLDLNSSGVLEMPEIRLLLETQCRRAPTEAEVADFMASADTDHDRVLSLNEYVATVFGDQAFTVEVPTSSRSFAVVHSCAPPPLMWSCWCRAGRRLCRPPRRKCTMRSSASY